MLRGAIVFGLATSLIRSRTTCIASIPMTHDACREEFGFSLVRGAARTGRAASPTEDRTKTPRVQDAVVIPI